MALPASHADPLPGRIKAAWHWRRGIGFGYPRCCIAHFCWDQLCKWPASIVRAHQVRDHGNTEYVVCGIFHAPGSPYGFVERIGRIVRWQLGRESTAIRSSGPQTSADMRWWSEQAVANRFSYGDPRGPYHAGAGLNPDLEWA